MAQVRGLDPRVDGRLALFCIHRVNRVYGALVVTSWTLLRRLIAYIVVSSSLLTQLATGDSGDRSNS